MIVIPRNIAPARPALPTRTLSESTRALVARIIAATAMLLALPGLAHASGGVAVTTTAASTTKATGSTADTPATAPTPAVRPHSVAKNQVRRAQTLLRLSPTGANDLPTRRVVKRFQALRGMTAYGIIDLPTYLQIKNAFALLETGGAGVDIAIDPATADGGASVAATTPAPALVLPPNLAPITPNERTILDTVAQCESQGNPTAISSDGQYRGKYQFDRATWKSVGGTGDPAAATEVEQDQRAAILLRQRGTAPWPVCAAA